MKKKKSKILLLALGNDILGDDGAAFAAAGKLEKIFKTGVEIIKSRESGLALLDIFKNYDSVLIIDTVSTGECPPGTVREFLEKDFRRISVPSLHFTGLPDILQLAGKLKISLPRELRFLALEIKPPEEFTEELTPAVRRAVPGFARQASDILSGWLKD